MGVLNGILPLLYLTHLSTKLKFPSILGLKNFKLLSVGSLKANCWQTVVSFVSSQPCRSIQYPFLKWRLAHERDYVLSVCRRGNHLYGPSLHWMV